MQNADMSVQSPVSSWPKYGADARCRVATPESSLARLVETIRSCLRERTAPEPPCAIIASRESFGVGHGNCYFEETPRPLGPEANGILMTPEEFDRADFEDGNRYELINGVLVVVPIPSEGEVDPNGELEYLLRHYRRINPRFGLRRNLDRANCANRRQPPSCQSVIWAGLAGGQIEHGCHHRRRVGIVA